MFNKGQKSLLQLLRLIAVIFIGGILFWLFQLDGIEVVRGWLKRPTIEAKPTTRRETDTFLADEKVRFFLKHVQSEKVFWMFDENHVYPGNVEIEYAFSFDENAGSGITCDHRVDVFFKRGTSYRTVSGFVRVQNIKYNVKLDVQHLEVSLSSDKILDDRWMVRGASLSKFEDGNFKSIFDLTFEKTKVGGIVTAAVNRETFIDLFSYPEDVDLIAQLAIRRDAWVTYEFIRLDGTESLVLAEPLSAMLR